MNTAGSPYLMLGTGMFLVPYTILSSLLLSFLLVYIIKTGPGAQYHIYETPTGCRSTDIFPPGMDPTSPVYPPYTLCTSTSNPVTTFGSPGSAAFSMDFQGVSAPAYPYPSSSAYLSVKISSYPLGLISISPQSITPPSSAGIIITQCASLLLYDVHVGTNFTISGLRCPLTIQSAEMATFTFSGTLGDYAGKAITITDYASSITVSVPASIYTITDKSIVGDSSLFISVPTSTRNLIIQGSSVPTQFAIPVVSPNTTVTINGGTMASVYTIQDIGAIYGRLVLNGGVQISMLNAFMLSVHAQDGPTVITTQTSMVQIGGATSFSVTYSNIGYRNLTFYAYPGVDLTHTLVTPEPGSTINIWSFGVTGGTITHQVTGCGAGGLVQINLSDPGEQLVLIGANGDLSAVQCNILAHGSRSVIQTISLIIDGTTDSRELLFTISIGALVVSNPAAPADFFSVQFSNIARIIISYGNGMNVVMGALTQSFQTEYLFIFPLAPTAPCSVLINALPNAMFINGSVTVTYNAQRNGITPFDNVQGMAVVAGTGNGINVVLTSALGTVPNLYYADSSCLGILNSTYGVISPYAPPSSWVCGLMQQAGFTDGCRNCQVRYIGSVSMAITTSNGNDYFFASSPQAQINFTALYGDDKVYHFAKI
jgi:hypothetical protein